MTPGLDNLRSLFESEASELLDRLEAGLLELEAGADRHGWTEELFRAAHSIKGGAAMIGWTAMAALVHRMEGVLERWRARTASPTPDGIESLLRMVDQLRHGLAHGGELPRASTTFDVVPDEPDEAPAPVDPDSDARGGVFRVHIKPAADGFARGSDPLLALRSVRDLSVHIEVVAHDTELPELTQLDPMRAYLQWTVEVFAKPGVTKEQLGTALASVQGEHAIETLWAADEALDPGPATAGPLPSVEPVPIAAFAHSSVRVPCDRLDLLLELLGELVVDHAAIQARVSTDERSDASLYELVDKAMRDVRELQTQVMAVRMVPLRTLFARVPRLVRELGATLGKDVTVHISGGDTELDKSLIEHLSSPLVHLVRNAIDHGIESAAHRLAAGKPATGTLRLSAYSRAGHVYIDISDDGRGIDRAAVSAAALARGVPVPLEITDDALVDILAAPGFSTAQTVSDISGRGVGLDAVRRDLQAIGGALMIETVKGQGTTFRVRVPLTLAIMDGLLMVAGPDTCVIPMADVDFATRFDHTQVRNVPGSGAYLDLPLETLPLVSLETALRGSRPDTIGIAVVVQAARQRYALQVDQLAGQAQVVVKNLERNFRRVPGTLGGTILGDGRVALIIDGHALPSVAVHGGA